MIRINLLAVERKPEPKVSRLAAQKVAILGTGIFALAALLVGWRVFALRSEAVRLDAELREAQAEQQRLRSILQQVEEFEKRKQQLQQRVALIEELRAGQSGPVRMLDEISRAMPDRLWLTELQQDASGVRIDGRTTSLTALSDFIGNLEQSGYFARPVEILDSKVDNTQGGADVVAFSVKAQFQLPAAAAPSATATPARPTATPTTPGRARNQ